jgi:hypothetical protein
LQLFISLHIIVVKLYLSNNIFMQNSFYSNCYSSFFKKNCSLYLILHPFSSGNIFKCFKFNLREVLDIRDFLKENTGALILRFDCMSKVDWFNFTLINFSVNVWDTLIWARRWPYESIDYLIWAHTCALRAYRRSEYVC